MFKSPRVKGDGGTGSVVSLLCSFSMFFIDPFAIPDHIRDGYKRTMHSRAEYKGVTARAETSQYTCIPNRSFRHLIGHQFFMA